TSRALSMINKTSRRRQERPVDPWAERGGGTTDNKRHHRENHMATVAPEALRDRIRRHIKTETGPHDVAKSVLTELEAEGPDAIRDALAEGLPMFARNVINNQRNTTKAHVPGPDPAPAPAPAPKPTGGRSRAHM